MCEVAKRNPRFRYLIRQIDLERFRYALEHGAVTPPRHYIPLEDYTTEKNGRVRALEEVFLSLVFDFHEKTPVMWKDSLSIMLVFPLSLLERDDYYFSLRDQFGFMTKHSYARESLVRGKLPPINFDPEMASKVGMIKYASNEVVFREEIPLDGYLLEIWIPGPKAQFVIPGGGNYDPQHTKIKTQMIKDLLRKHNLQGKVSVKQVDFFPSRKQLLAKCDPESVADSKKYKGFFCRSTGHMVDYLDIVDKSKLVKETWQFATHLDTKRKIALNCGIPESEVNKIYNPDLIDSDISTMENSFITFITELKKRGLTDKQVDEELRKAIPPQKYLPPFDDGPPLPEGTPSDLNELDPFYRLVSLITQFVEEEIQYAIANKTFALTKEQILKRLYDFYDRYTNEIHARELLGLASVLANYSTTGQFDEEDIIKIFNDLYHIVQNKELFESLRKQYNEYIDKLKINEITAEQLTSEFGKVLVDTMAKESRRVLLPNNKK